MDRVSKTAIVIALALTLLIGFGYARFRRFEERGREIDRLRQTIDDARREVERKEHDAAEMETELKAMERDPAAREAAARQGLRWVREGEKVYIVEEPWEVVNVGVAPEEGSTAPGTDAPSPDQSGSNAAVPPAPGPDIAPLVPPDPGHAATGSPGIP
ncbi:MAG TPA: hypothetical protein PK379_01850 [Candidatus Hydrogenedentes bacterium]|nr:hypothetical protein [Candidatus Hydrogenedentota bacterium]